MAAKSLMSMSRRDADDLHSSMRASHKYLSSQRDEGKKSKKAIAKVGLEAIEVGVGALGVGYLAGRLESTQIGSTGIPTGLAIAAAGHALAYFDVLGGGFSDHIHNVSNGALAGWLALWGAGQGTNSRLKAGQPVTAISAGEPKQMPQPQPKSPLTEAELAAVGAKVRR